MSEPLACSLAAPVLAERERAIAQPADEALVERRLGTQALRLRFRADAEPRIRELVALEQQCCPFLAFRLERDGDHVLLEVAAPAEARPLLERLFTR